MEFFYTLVTQYEPGRDRREIAPEIGAQVALAREAGFDAIRVGEHHATDDQYLLNEAVLAHVSALAGDMDVMTGLCLLPYHNPVRIAEYGATLDVLTDGGFRLGVGQGYRPEEFAVFGVDPADAPGRLVEGLEVIERLWTEDRVTYRGEHFDLSDVSINPKPLREPRPPIVVGASNERSVRRAARVADGWWGSHVPFDVLRGYAEAFRDERDREADGRGTIGITREVFVAETDAAAEAAVRDPLVAKYERYTDWGQGDVFEADTFERAWDELAADRFVVGSPETVVEELARYRDGLGLDFVSPRMQYPGMTFEDARASVELFADEVAPRL